jgi:hypothetical protein
MTMNILEKSGKTMSVAASTSEETLASILIPANLLGKNGALRVTTFWDVTGSANTKRIREYLGGALVYDINLNVATVESNVNQLQIMNQDNVAEQVCSPLTTPAAGLGASTDPLTLTAVDMSQNQILRITGEKDNAGDGLRLRGYMIEYMP